MGRRARALAWILLAFAGCNKGPAATTSPAEKPHVEADLSRTSISDKQYQSLEIKTQPAGHEEAQAERACTAFVTARPEDSVTIAAPVPGVINAARKTAFPVPGQKLSAGTKMLELQPVVSPLDEVQLAVLKRGFESEFKKAEEKVKVVASEVKRLKELVDQKLRGKPDLEDAEARLNQAKEDVSAAEYKLNLFQKDKKAGLELPALSIDSPQAGAIVAVHVSPGQYVPAATPLVQRDEPGPADMAACSCRRRTWTRRSDGAVAPTRRRGKTDKKLSVTATPVAVVPEVDRLKHTVTLLYSFKRPAGAAREGPVAQRRRAARQRRWRRSCPIRRSCSTHTAGAGSTSIASRRGTRHTFSSDAAWSWAPRSGSGSSFARHWRRATRWWSMAPVSCSAASSTARRSRSESGAFV
ncbi:MAG: hypothetical protein U0793_02330 [Gemmataceae bacterium]